MIKGIPQKLLNLIKLEIYKKTWRKHNNHNYTTVKNIFPLEKVSVGKYTYGPLTVIHYGNPNEQLIIGSYCSIAGGVKFLLGGEHHPEYLMNYPFKYYLLPTEAIDDRRTKGTIVVGDDVWIGTDAIVLSGVTIGQGAIIAAGSIVTKDVPPYAVYTTNRIIKYRFSKEVIEKLMHIDFSKMDFKFVNENLELFYTNEVENTLSNHKIKRYMKE